MNKTYLTMFFQKVEFSLLPPLSKELRTWAGRMALGVRAVKPGVLSAIPETHMVEDENQLLPADL